MARYSRFTFLCDLVERRAIADLAARLQRSQSDSVWVCSGRSGAVVGQKILCLGYRPVHSRAENQAGGREC